MKSQYKLHIENIGAEETPGMSTWTVGGYVWIYSIKNMVGVATPQFNMLESGIYLHTLLHTNANCKCGCIRSIQYIWSIAYRQVCSITHCAWCMYQLASENCAM
jgi:hypothetical protein